MIRVYYIIMSILKLNAWVQCSGKGWDWGNIVMLLVIVDYVDLYT